MKKTFNDKYLSKEEPKGMVMLLSLLVLSATTAVAVGMSILIIKEVRQSSEVDRSQLSFYAAETGIERGLFLVKKARREGVELSPFISDLILEGETFTDNGASWNTEASGSNEQYAITLLNENKTLVMDLYDPSDPLNAGFDSFSVEAIDANPINNEAWLEISYFPWTIDAAGGYLTWDDEKVAKRIRSVIETEPNAPAIFSDVVTTENYRIRIKALYDDLKNVRITGYDQNDPINDCNPDYSCIKAIPNRVVIRSTGIMGDNRTGLSASVPWQAPASGIFDYVLFSQQDIDKKT